MKYLNFDELNKYSFLNVIFTGKEVDVSKKEDRERTCKDLGFKFENMTFSKQVHGSDIRIIEKDNIGEIKEADGLITKLKNVPLMIFVADCVAIGAIDIEKKVIGVAHAGWRGTFEEIGSKLIKKMNEEFGCENEDIKIVIGPSIGPCCYEVSEDLIEKFKTKFNDIKNDFYSEKEGKYHLDLWKINENLLLNNGIKKENIINLNLCTYCNENLFHSYRKDNGTPKRMGLILELLEGEHE